MKKILMVMALVITCLVGCKEKNSENAFREALKSFQATGAGKAVLLPEEVSITKECDKVMGALAAGDVPQAFAYMEKIFPLPAEDFKKLKEDTAKMLESAGPRFGKIVGYELVAVTKKSDSVLASTYILKMETMALRWRFILYKPKDIWVINSMRWDNNLGEDW